MSAIIRPFPFGGNDTLPGLTVVIWLLEWEGLHRVALKDQAVPCDLETKGCNTERVVSDPRVARAFAYSESERLNIRCLDLGPLDREVTNALAG